MNRTAECVSPLHPDKICDVISDTILDKILELDPFARVAVETMGGHGEIKVTGEVTFSEEQPRLRDPFYYDSVIRSVVGKGYKIDVNVVEQSRPHGMVIYPCKELFVICIYTNQFTPKRLNGGHLVMDLTGTFKIIYYDSKRLQKFWPLCQRPRN